MEHCLHKASVAPGFLVSQILLNVEHMEMEKLDLQSLPCVLIAFGKSVNF